MVKTPEVTLRTLGRATYEPGWKWSEHVGTATVAFEDGRVIELREGALFHVRPLREVLIRGGAGRCHTVRHAREGMSNRF